MKLFAQGVEVAPTFGVKEAHAVVGASHDNAIAVLQ
jgi:hypothetical protein